MIMGCTSDAGKSFLVSALCRALSNRGEKVAPFKAQNMSNNAAVTADGAEIGRAQYLQALAARVAPEARMNPILLKPSGDTHSQVIVLGSANQLATQTPWMERRKVLWPVVCEALHSLLADWDRVIIEGAGSPAEINLREADMVNMAVALECRADVYLASDIDRGGSFAHLLGTYMALQEPERARIKGFILNRFRGDPKLLGNASQWLEERTGVPTVALVPYMRHCLPEEDALHHRGRPQPGAVNIALLAYPWASNLDEFDPLVYTDGVHVVPLRERVSLLGYDAVLLPGSKNTVASLNYLRETGLDHELLRAAQEGVLLLGVCGGMQLLGKVIRDPGNVEGGDARGLGLLEVETEFTAAKQTRQVRSECTLGGPVQGYEIHHGRTRAGSGCEAYLSDNLGWRQGSVIGVYLHGIAENSAWRAAFLRGLGWSGEVTEWRETIDSELNRAAELIEGSGLLAAVLERSHGDPQSP